MEQKSLRLLGGIFVTEESDLFGLSLRFQLAHADGLGLAVLGKSVYALNGEEGVLALSGKVVA